MKDFLVFIIMLIILSILVSIAIQDSAELQQQILTSTQVNSVLSSEINQLEKELLIYQKNIRELLLQNQTLSNQLSSWPQEFEQWYNSSVQFPTATKIWIFLRIDLGWSAEVAAGVMGNLMAETGGDTLNIKWNLWNRDKTCYGICQWAIKWNPTMSNATLDEQLIYLQNNVESIMNAHGSNYAPGFTYNDFIQLNTPEAASDAFAKCYERCLESEEYRYKPRRLNAIAAYNYYTSNTRP